MHTLHVRNVPNELYASLRQRARERKTSISRETIRLLARALRTDRRGVRELLHQIESDRPVARRGTPSAAELIREDRDRR
jgi:plasmid stability protein